MREQALHTIVVGSGAAGFSAALRLDRLGVGDLALITENRMAGTSRNTGSDKQTYYKLSVSGSDPDSVRGMAQDLFEAGCVDGDQALCEAALSARCFYNLVELGVPFPDSPYGEFVGYKTDHDPRTRATSAGPYTSKMMTEVLEREVSRRGIQVIDHMQAIRILTEDGRVTGLLCLDTSDPSSYEYVLLHCQNIVMATGGPAGMYRDSVYPASQIGSTGMVFAAGAAGKNLTEWQCGIASLNPRWNTSGTYMQVLPRVLSTDKSGNDEREFLLPYFDTPEQMLGMIFLKGYQWPFDVQKALSGSSFIDLLIYQETVLRGRRVFLDYRQNTSAGIRFEELPEEAYTYLRSADACGGTPIERLLLMNEPAVSFYRDRGVDLSEEPLEIAVCVQHNNGGIATDANWETCVRGLFAIGELNGSHGVTRPGGSALNAGQVGALRAAQCIALRSRQSDPSGGWHNDTASDKLQNVCDSAKERNRAQAAAYISFAEGCLGSHSAAELWKSSAASMSRCAGMIRSAAELRSYFGKIQLTLQHLQTYLRKPRMQELPLYYHLIDMLVSQSVYLSAMIGYAEKGLASRGSALYTDKHGCMPPGDLPEIFRFRPEEERGDLLQEMRLSISQGEDGLGISCAETWRKVRPLPDEDLFFENQWRAYRGRWNL